MTSTIAERRLARLRLDSRNLIWVWTASAMIAPMIVALGAIELLRPDVFELTQLIVAATCWMVGAGGVSFVISQRLSGILGRPIGTIANLARIDGHDDLPVSSNLGLALSELDGVLVRTAHEKNGRLAELTRAREQARAEGEAHARFFAGMSHELRAPLNAIIGYAMLLEEDATSAGELTLAKDLDRILQSSRHLLRLINDLLDLSRLDAGDIEIEREVIDVPGLLRAVMATHADTAMRNGFEVAINVSPAAKIILGDNSRLQHCLSSLINGLLESGRDQTTNLQVVAVDGARVEVRLGDPIGNLADAIDQAPMAASKIQGPSGARLADALMLSATVVARLARLMGGEVRTERSPNGAVVVVELPTNTETRTEGGDQTSVLTAFPVRATSDVATVLVIDDDAATLDLVKRWMTARGMRTLTASNGEQGLELARLHQPDYVILDIFMPGRSGYEVLEELRKDPDLAAIPVIVISSDDNRRLGLEAGAAEVLVKPLSRERLGATLDVLKEQVSGDILVVDDDRDVREIVHRYAARAGLAVRLASNGREGIAQARERKPGAIVLDLRMPGGNGFEMLEKLMEDEVLREVPVMVLSQLDLSVAQHMRLRDAGHAFHPKWRSSPLQIVENIKVMVAR